MWLNGYASCVSMHAFTNCGRELSKAVVWKITCLILEMCNQWAKY